MEPTRDGKPEGGYVLLTPGRILRAWELHHAKIITLLDLRVWLACHELVARRLGPQNRARANYTLDELATLTNSTRTAASLRRLERCGLLSWSPRSITFSEALPEHSSTDSVSLRRLVPMPRRWLRSLAGGVSRATLATALGLLIRCAYFKRGVCSWECRCKASWVAQTFGIHTRSVKRALASLTHAGWVRGEDGPQWATNRWGGKRALGLSTDKSTRLSRRPLSPRRPRRRRRLSPLDSHQHPLRASKHHHPAPLGPDGVWKAGFTNTRRLLGHIEPGDLTDHERLQALYRTACTVRLATASEAGWLAFRALAARARRCGTANPAGLFAWLLRLQHWDRITTADEQGARTPLSEHARVPFKSKQAGVTNVS